jgi:hypothetical protein
VLGGGRGGEEEEKGVCRSQQSTISVGLTKALDEEEADILRDAVMFFIAV